MRFVLSIAAGVALGIAGLAAAFWVISTFIAVAWPRLTGRVVLSRRLRALGVPPGRVEPEIVAAAAALAWEVAALDPPRMQNFSRLLEFYARVIADQRLGRVAPEDRETCDAAYAAILKTRARREKFSTP